MRNVFNYKFEISDRVVSVSSYDTFSVQPLQMYCIIVSPDNSVVTFKTISHLVCMHVCMYAEAMCVQASEWMNAVLCEIWGARTHREKHCFRCFELTHIIGGAEFLLSLSDECV
jgi:hypothetical protein